MTVLGAIFTAFIFLFIIIVIILVGYWMLPKKVKFFLREKIWPIVWKILVFVILVGAIYWIFFTETGQFITVSGQEEKSHVQDTFSGAAAQFNVLKMILLGEYDPSEIWKSDTYEDKYAAPPGEVGVYVTNEKAIRSSFRYGDDITLVGLLNIDGLPDPDFAESTTVLYTKFSEIEKLNLIEFGEPWLCKPPSVEGKYATRRQFTCEIPSAYTLGLDVDIGKKKAYSVDVVTTYTFETLAGKQVPVILAEELANVLVLEKDPIEEFGITKEQTTSWQTEDPVVEFGMGLASEYEYMATLHADLNPVANYLGVTVENKKGGDIVGISDLILVLPCSISIGDACNTKEERKKIGVGATDCDFMPYAAPACVDDDNCAKSVGFRCINNKCIIPDLDSLELCAYTLNPDTGYTAINEKDPIEPGDHRSYLLKFTVTKNFLKDQASSDFFILADLHYVYKDADAVSVTIENPEAPPLGFVGAEVELETPLIK
jgi:hypothetical protein